MMATSSTTSRYYRTLKKKRKIRNKIVEMTKGQVKSPDTKTVLFALLVLGFIFAIIAYFKPT